MVKVMLERTIKGKHVSNIVRLLRRMRVLAMQQPGYISGETLHALDDPNHYLVISTWETMTIGRPGSNLLHITDLALW